MIQLGSNEKLCEVHAEDGSNYHQGHETTPANVLNSYNASQMCELWRRKD